MTPVAQGGALGAAGLRADGARLPAEPRVGVGALRAIAFLIALCLVGCFASYFLLGSEVVMEACFLGLTIPAALWTIFGFADMGLTLRTYAKTMLYLLPVLFSFAVNSAPEERFVHDIVVILNLFYAFFLAALFESRPELGLNRRVMRQLVVLSIPFFLLTLLLHRGDTFWGRWEPYGLQPNWWGMMALGLAWSSLAWESLLVRLPALGLALYFFVALQSRGAIVAFAPAFLFSSGWFFPLNRKTAPRLLLFGFAGLCAVFFVELFTSMGIVDRAVDFVTNDVFLLNNAYRGLGTDMSGRVSGYITAWNSFLDSPLFGAGFANFGFVHNGFLLTLAESGVLALLGMVYLVGAGLVRSFRNRRWASFGYLLSYTAALMTYPRSFNINMTAMLAMLVMMQELGASREADPQ